MIRVGLIGEDPNDTKSVENLLNQKYNGRIQFLTLLKSVKGYQLDNPKVKKSLPIEFFDKGCNFAIYIRDLDGFGTETIKKAKRIQWFKELDSTVNKKGILLLNIWELEALIFADINVFNQLYKTSFKFKGDPTFIKEPKEVLKRITSGLRKRYHESDCPDIFKKLDFDVVKKKCSCFAEFVLELNLKLKKK
jgi:hypothetical protein